MSLRRCCFALLIVAVPVAILCLQDSRRVFTYLPGPAGMVLRCQADQSRVWSFGGTIPHSGGGFPLLPRRRWGTAVRTFTLCRTPPRADEDWATWPLGLAAGQSNLVDMWFDPVQQRVMVGAPGVGLALSGVAPVVPATCSQAPQLRDLEMDFPVELFAYSDVPATGPDPSACSVTAFGAVEPGADGALNWHEWSPTPDGCFTRWWESPAVPQHRHGRYNPPWQFDRIDRRTTIHIEQTGKSKGRFSSRGFLYRLGDVVTGIYWPDLKFRRSAESDAMSFLHVFGRCNASSDAVIELLCVDASGRVWKFPETAASFEFSPSTAMHPHDRKRVPGSPNEWLRYDVKDIESVLSGEGAPVPHQVAPR